MEIEEDLGHAKVRFANRSDSFSAYAVFGPSPGALVDDFVVPGGAQPTGSGITTAMVFGPERAPWTQRLAVIPLPGRMEMGSRLLRTKDDELLLPSSWLLKSRHKKCHDGACFVPRSPIPQRYIRARRGGEGQKIYAARVCFVRAKSSTPNSRLCMVSSKCL